jgi:hypothetical protein
MNNALNSNEIPQSRSLAGVRTTLPVSTDLTNRVILGSDKPRVLHMSATLRRILNEVNAAQNNITENGIARA